MQESKKSKLRKIGGRLYDAFVMVEREIDSINEDYFPLLKYLGLTDDVQKLIDILVSERLEDAIKAAYKNKEQLNIKFSEDAEKAKQEKISYNGKISFYLKRVFKEYSVYLYPTLNKRALEAYREALYTNPNGICINTEKFKEIYISRLVAEKSDTRKLHEEIAEKIMRFFNGVPITKEELTRYFILDGGVVTINPISVNAQDYARLGRTYKKEIAQSSEQIEVKARGGNRKKSNT